MDDLWVWDTRSWFEDGAFHGEHVIGAGWYVVWFVGLALLLIWLWRRWRG